MRKIQKQNDQRKSKGIMDTLIDVLNEGKTENEEKFVRMHTVPKMEHGDGKWRTTDGRYC